MSQTSLRFDGINDYAVAGAGDGDPGAGPFILTMLMVFTGDGISVQQAYIHKRSGLASGQGVAFFHDRTSNNLVFEIEDDAGNEASIQYSVTSAALNDGAVRTVTIGRSVSGGEMWMLVDGVSVGSVDSSGVGSVYAPESLTFGRSSFAATNFSSMDLLWAGFRFVESTEAGLLAESLGVPATDDARDLYWDFEDGSGATASAYPEWRRDYLQGDGATDQITASDSVSLSPSSVSLELWVRAENLGGSNQLLAQKAKGYRMRSSGTSHKLNGFIYDGTSFKGAPASTEALVDHTAYHLMLTYDETEDDLALFIRGGADGFDDNIGPSGANDSADAFTAYLDSNGVKGTIFGLRVWGDKRSAAEVAVDAKTLDRSGEGNLAMQWKMDEASGTSLTDSSANSNTGTVSGPTWGSNNLTITGAVWVAGSDSDVSVTESAITTIGDFSPFFDVGSTLHPTEGVLVISGPLSGLNAGATLGSGPGSIALVGPLPRVDAGRFSGRDFGGIDTFGFIGASGRDTSTEWVNATPESVRD